MQIVDKTGRKLKVGQIVDVMMMGMFQGRIEKIAENAIALPDGNVINPHIIIMIPCTPGILPNGLTPEVYIIGEPNPKEQKGLVVDGDFAKKPS